MTCPVAQSLRAMLDASGVSLPNQFAASQISGHLMDVLMIHQQAGATLQQVEAALAILIKTWVDVRREEGAA